MNRKRNSTWGKKLLSLVLAGVCCLATTAFTPLESDEEAYERILQKGQAVDFEQPYQELAPLEPELANYEIYLSGEGHAVQMNFTMQKYLLQYFVEEQGVRYLLMEASYTEGELLNRYLETGDGELINTIVNSFEGSLAYNQDTLDFYRWLYRYNQSLPENKRLRIVAVDVEHQKDLSSLYLRSLLQGKEVPDSISDVVGQLRKDSHILWDPEFCQRLADSVEQHEKEYKSVLKDDFFTFSLSVKNLLASTDDFTQRETAIISNFNTLYDRLPKGKYFGQFGSAHTVKGKIQFGEDSPEVDSFTNSINTSDQLNGKVFVLRFLYNNCYFRDIQGKVSPVGNLEILALYGDEPTVLFLNRNVAPELYDYISGGDPALDAFSGDHIYVISNSPPVSKRITVKDAA